MKTPDEIKKGLEVCSKDKCVCDECEFGGNVWKWRKLMGDALAYIQQLETRLAQVERERDAAVAEIKRMEGKAKELLETEIHDAILRELPYSDYMDFINQVEQICNYQFEDEWRGVCEENTPDE